MMEWILLLSGLWVILLGWKEYRETPSRRQQIKKGQALTAYELALDAREAVAGFAQLCSRMIEQLGIESLAEEPFAKAWVTLCDMGNEGQGELRMSVSFVWPSVDRVIEEMGYRLGEGFTVEDGIVAWESRHIQNIRAWLGDDMWQKEDAGKIAGLFSTHCPLAYSSREYIMGKQITIEFRFK